MSISEVIKGLEREEKMACFDCVHPQSLGWCEKSCKTRQTFEEAIRLLKLYQEKLDER